MIVIVINGPMGIGKTTVGTYIADSNPGTAFIDGDWCMDLHPFVGNKETRDMAVNNILNITDQEILKIYTKADAPMISIRFML